MRGVIRFCKKIVIILVRVGNHLYKIRFHRVNIRTSHLQLLRPELCADVYYRNNVEIDFHIG